MYCTVHIKRKDERVTFPVVAKLHFMPFLQSELHGPIVIPPPMLTSPCCTGFTQIIVENCQFSQINSAVKNTEILTDTNYQNQLNENPFIRAFSFPQRDEAPVNDLFLP